MQFMDDNYITQVPVMPLNTTVAPTEGLAATINNNTTQNKVDTLGSSVQSKIARLAGKGVSTIEDKGVQATVGEHPERVNYMTPTQLQEEFGTAATYQILERPDGSKYQFRHNPDGTYAHGADGQWIEDAVAPDVARRNLYVDTTAEGNYKLGLARSDVNPEMKSPWTGEDITPFEARYMNQAGTKPYVGSGSAYDGTPGPRGVTPENGALMDITLPKAVVDVVEYDTHTNVGQLASRAMGQGPKTDETTAQFGGGQSEYTTPDAPMWNVNYDISKAKVAKDTVLPKEVKVVNGHVAGSPVTSNQYVKQTGKKYTEDELKQALGLDKERSWGDAIKDTGLQTVVGSLNAVKNLADIYGVATGDMDTWVGDVANRAAKWYGEKYSPALHAVEKAKASEIAKGKTELDKFVIATKENFNNPMLISQLVVESAPMMITALAAGEVAAPVLGISAAEGMLAAGAMQQGADMGREVFNSFMDEGINRKISEKDWQNNPKYKELVASGMDSDEAKYEIAVNAARVVSLASGLLSYGVNRFMPGGSAIESKLTGAGATGMLKGTAGESVTEMLEEGGGKTFQNIGLQQVNPEIKTEAGVGEVAADAMAAGGATNIAVSAPGMLGGGSKLSKEQRELLDRNDEVVATETVKAEDLKTGLTEEDIDNAKGIYEVTKSGQTIQDARDLAEAVDKLETSDVKSDKGFKIHEAGADRRAALTTLLRDAYARSHDGIDYNNEAELDAATEEFKQIVKSYGLSKRNRMTLNELLMAGMMYGTEGSMEGLASVLRPGLKLNPISGTEQVTQKEELTPGLKLNTINVEQPQASNLVGLRLKPITVNDTVASTPVEVKEAVKAKVEAAKKESVAPTDEDLGVGAVTEDGYTKGVSARTLNRLAKMFDLDVKDVRDSVQFAMPNISIKQMSTVSKEAGKVQYETYHGANGIMPSYVGFKKATAEGEVDKAYEYIDRIRQAGTRLDRELFRHDKAEEELAEQANAVLDKYAAGKLSAEKAASTLAVLDVNVGKKYKIHAVDIVEVPEEISKLMPKTETSKVPEVTQAKKEARALVDEILAFEGISRTKPVYEKSYVSDKVKQYEDRVANTKKEIEEQENEVAAAETNVDKAVAKKVLASLNKRLKEQEAALETYNTRYADKEYTWKEVFNKEKEDATAKDEVASKSGEQVGKVSEEQKSKLETRGIEVSEDKVADKISVTAVKDIAGKVKELARLRNELDAIKEKSNTKYADVKAKIAELQEYLNDSTYRKIQTTVDGLHTDLTNYRADRRRLKAELAKASKLESDLITSKIGIATAYANAEIAANDTTSSKTLKQRVVQALGEAGKNLKLTIARVRLLLANRSVEQIKAELATVEESIAKTQAKLKDAVKAGVAKIKAETGLKSAEANKVVNALKNIKRLRAMVGKTAEGSNKIQEARDKNTRKVWDKIKEIEASLYGTRLVRENRPEGKDTTVTRRVSNTETVEVNTNLGSMLKYSRTLFGHVEMEELAELITDAEVKAEYIKIVANAGKDFEKAIGKLENEFTIADSPAMYFMRTADGKIDKQVAAVVALAANEYIATTAKASLSNSRDTIARMVGKLDGAQVNRKEARLLKEGRLLVNEATSVGGNILNALGIREGSMPIGQYAQLKADFGNYAMSYLQDRGLIQFKAIDQKEWNEAVKGKQMTTGKAQVLLVVGLESKVAEYEKTKKVVQSVNDDLDLQDFGSNYKVAPIKTAGKIYKIENGYSAAPEYNQSVLRKLESQKWRLATEAMYEFATMSDEVLKELMGWKDLSKMNPKGGEVTHTKEAKEAQESVNREVEGNLEALRHMQDRYNRGLIGKDVYYEWFFSKNGRYMLDSVGVNPQVDKQLARFLVVPKEATETVWDLNNDKDRLYFASGVMQGLGIDLDNKSTAVLKATGESILALDKKAVEELAESIKATGKYNGNGLAIKVSHIGHALQAIAALKAERTNGKVRATVTMEFDSKTSGFFHKLMQMPFESKEEQVAWLAKTGAYAYFDEPADPAKGVGTNDKMVKEVDAYRTLTMDSDKVLKRLLKEDNELKAMYDSMISAGVVPLLIDEEGVTSEGRNLYKYPFMRFNYAESIKSNRKSMALDLTTQALDKIAAGEIELNDKTEAFYKSIGVTSKEALESLRKDLATKDLDKVWVGKLNLEKALSERFDSLYGAALEEVMNKNFSHILEANKLMIAATQIMADAFIAELEGIDTTMLTEDELEAEIEKYIKVFPQIRAPFTESRDRGMVIIDTERAEASGKWKADTRLPSSSENKTRTVQALVQAFKASAAAGAVIPTHWTDGAVIGEVLSKGGILGIHDAIALGFDGATIEGMVKAMNKSSYEVNRDFNIMQNIYTALVESLSSASDEALAKVNDKVYNKSGEDGMSVAEVVEELRKSTNEYNKRRAKMYSGNVTVGNIIAYEDTVYRNYTDGNKPEDSKEYLATNKVKDGKISQYNNTANSLVEAAKGCAE